MLILLICICIIVSVVSYKVDDFFGFVSLFFTTTIALISAIALMVNVYSLVDYRTLDNKITMYTEENQKIETSISETVNTYLTHEKETYTSITPESAAFFATVYPELQSSELAQKQIQTYIDNNNKIKELKEKKISVSNAKWWVYFGG